MALIHLKTFSINTKKNKKKKRQHRRRSQKTKMPKERMLKEQKHLQKVEILNNMTKSSK